MIRRLVHNSCPCVGHCVQALFCEACGCWVPSAPDTKEEMWREHLQSKRHAREAASRLREEATRQSTHHYRSALDPVNSILMCMDVLGFLGGHQVSSCTAPFVLQAKLVLTMPNVTIALRLHLEEGYLGHPGSTFAAAMQLSIDHFEKLFILHSGMQAMCCRR